jgi:hypothetical protein
MSRCQYEPTLEEILSDPIIAAVMEADDVDVQELDEMLAQIARGLDAARDDDVALAPQ